MTRAAGTDLRTDSALGCGMGVLVAQSAAPEEAARSVHGLMLLLVVVLVLLVITLLGFILLRSSRKLRQFILRQPAEPTKSSDIWSTHRLPEEDEADGDG